ncbi:MAG: hypothetical protein RLZZ196_1409 [Bacteroidota bacterium]|jgi:hypothetical protein
MYTKLHSKPKLDIIAHSLTRSGVTLWHGIPEQIIKDLHTAGYKIKKRKRFKKIAKQIDSRKVPLAIIKSQHEDNKDIYL